MPGLKNDMRAMLTSVRSSSAGAQVLVAVIVTLLVVGAAFGGFALGKRRR